MSLGRTSNGRVGDPEVIVNVRILDNFCVLSAHIVSQFHDGFAYSKGKMEEVFRSGLFDKQPTKPMKEIGLAKREDVDLIVTAILTFEYGSTLIILSTQVHELEIPRAQAEKALTENGGDLEKALRALITP
jgi:hypothetical protein